jgi:hypothetical protein
MHLHTQLLSQFPIVVHLYLLLKDNKEISDSSGGASTGGVTLKAFAYTVSANDSQCCAPDA